MKKLLLWLVMVVVMLAVLLGGAGYAMYAMTGDDKLPTQHPTLGDTELEPIGYDWSVPVLGNVLNRTFEQPSTLTVQKLGEMTEAAPGAGFAGLGAAHEPYAERFDRQRCGAGDAAAFAMYAYPKNGSYELTLTAYRNTAGPRRCHRLVPVLCILYHEHPAQGGAQQRARQPGRRGGTDHYRHSGWQRADRGNRPGGCMVPPGDRWVYGLYPGNL